MHQEASGADQEASKSHQFRALSLDIFGLESGHMGLSMAIGLPPVIIHFERWDFP